LFRQNHLRDQAVMTGVLAAVLAGVLFLIYSLDQPFTGLMKVSKQPLHHAVQQFDAIDRPPIPTCCGASPQGPRSTTGSAASRTPLPLTGTEAGRRVTAGG
jgi:hypothetical protein